jgi:hypothetical protein
LNNRPIGGHSSEKSLKCGHLVLFIPQITYEHGEPQWNDIDVKTEKLGEKRVPVPLHPP